MKYVITESQYKNLFEDIDPSKKALKNICDSEKFCNAQGKITFGQLKAIVENATKKRLYLHIGEGGYKATLRLLPWFLPQIAIGGFIASSLRAANKILRPTLEETNGYKTWWGKAVMKSFDLVEGELGIDDPLSKIFFISDGLMTMMDDKYKVKFAKHIANLASEMPDDAEVPEYFVENELRNWINKKFLLDPPLGPKQVEEVNEITDKIYKKISTYTPTLTESKKEDEGVVRDILNNLKTTSGVLMSFGTGMGAFIGPAKKILENSGFSMTQEEVGLLIVTAFSILIQSPESKELLEKIKENGLTSFLKKTTEFITKIKTLINVILKNTLGVTYSLIDILSFAILLIPTMEIITDVIKDFSINFDSLNKFFTGLILSSTLYAVNSIIKKIKSKL